MANAAIVLSKLRQALVAYIASHDVGTTNIYDGQASGEKVLPCIICDALDATEDPPLTGNHWVPATITLETSSQVQPDGIDPKIASEAIWTALCNALAVDDLPAQLSAALADFTAIGIGDENGYREERGEDVWLQMIGFKVYCCASDL